MKKWIVWLCVILPFIKGHSQELETLVTDGKDSLMVFHERIPSEIADTLAGVSFQKPVQKLYELRQGLLVVFDDQQRRVLSGADSIVLTLNEQVFKFTSIEDILIKHAGPGQIFSLTLQAYSGGELIPFPANTDGALKLTFLDALPETPYFTDDRIVFGILFLVLAAIFYTSALQNNRFWKRFYTIIPALFLCYFIPALLTTFDVISSEHSKLYPMARDYLLPASLILMTLSIDLKGLVNLGPKSLIMFLTGTVGIIIGGVASVGCFRFLVPKPWVERVTKLLGADWQHWQVVGLEEVQTRQQCLRSISTKSHCMEQ
jgi:hypothetical protein